MYQPQDQIPWCDSQPAGLYSCHCLHPHPPQPPIFGLPIPVQLCNFPKRNPLKPPSIIQTVKLSSTWHGGLSTPCAAHSFQGLQCVPILQSKRHPGLVVHFGGDSYSTRSRGVGHRDRTQTRKTTRGPKSQKAGSGRAWPAGASASTRIRCRGRHSPFLSWKHCR